MKSNHEPTKAIDNLASLSFCQSVGQSVSLSGSHLNSACMDTKPGKCFSEQVGVKAPGTPTTMVRFPARWAVQGRSLAQGMDQYYFPSSHQNFRACSSLNFDEGMGKLPKQGVIWRAEWCARTRKNGCGVDHIDCCFPLGVPYNVPGLARWHPLSVGDANQAA
jgi:hypothetical protein